MDLWQHAQQLFDAALHHPPEKRQEFAADRERLRRFEQEARAAAALNHPNIVSVHDMGTADGSPYIVSELLDGQNLAEVLRQGPVAARKALEYAIQAARGLAAAH